jgi:hypothetical protein
MWLEMEFCCDCDILSDIWRICGSNVLLAAYGEAGLKSDPPNGDNALGERRSYLPLLVILLAAVEENPKEDPIESLR